MLTIFAYETNLAGGATANTLDNHSDFKKHLVNEMMSSK